MQTKCHVQLRGRGSGTLEPETNQERGFNMIQRCNVVMQNSFCIILCQVELVRVLECFRCLNLAIHLLKTSMGNWWNLWIAIRRGYEKIINQAAQELPEPMFLWLTSCALSYSHCKEARAFRGKRDVFGLWVLGRRTWTQTKQHKTWWPSTCTDHTDWFEKCQVKTSLYGIAYFNVFHTVLHYLHSCGSLQYPSMEYLVLGKTTIVLDSPCHLRTTNPYRFPLSEDGDLVRWQRWERQGISRDDSGLEFLWISDSREISGKTFACDDVQSCLGH